MTTLGRIALTGAGGRLGRALANALAAAGETVVAWRRPDYDLDDRSAPERLILRDQPNVVIHTAAWTDVDANTREPDLAQRRNGAAVGDLATSCQRHGADLLVVSTNEVFDGHRTDGIGYRESDPAAPQNAYGASKLAGEDAARKAFSKPGSGRLWIVRTAWLFGPPGGDFPAKILAAADRLPHGEPLTVVADEFGSPTSAMDLAPAILEVVRRAQAGTYHLVNEGRASRADWAALVLRGCGRENPIRPVSQAEFKRLSRPPAWSVLDGGAARELGISLRPWQQALADYLPVLCPER